MTKALPLVDTEEQKRKHYRKHFPPHGPQPTFEECPVFECRRARSQSKRKKPRHR